MPKFSSITFTSSDFIKAIGGVIFIGSAWFHIISNQNDLKEKIMSLSINGIADDKIVASKIQALELSAMKADNRLNEFEKWRFKVEAILPEETKIKKSNGN